MASSPLLRNRDKFGTYGKSSLFIIAMGLKSILTAACWAICASAAVMDPGSSISSSGGVFEPATLGSLMSNTVPNFDIASVNTLNRSAVFPVPGTEMTLVFHDGYPPAKISQSDISVAITEFLVAAFRTLLMNHGRDIPLPVGGLTSSYRNIRLGFLPKPHFARDPHGLEFLVGALKGIMYYMTYSPDGFTERTIDIYVPASVGVVNVLVGGFVIAVAK